MPEITLAEVVWIAGRLGGGGGLQEATPLPLEWDDVVRVVEAGVDADADDLRGLNDVELDTLPERLRALTDGRDRLLRVVEETLTIDANTGIRDAQTLAVTMTSDERVALATKRAGRFATFREKEEIVGPLGEWHLLARWRSNQREQDLAALRIAYEASQAPPSVGGEDDAAPDALETLIEVAELCAWGYRIDAELRRLGVAMPPPAPAAEVP